MPDSRAMPSDTVLAQIVRQCGDAVIIADPQGTIVFWNGAAERVFGWPATYSLGRSLDLIIPEAQRARHWEGYRTVMHTGITRYGNDVLRVPSLHADGERRSVAFTVTLLTDEAGHTTGIAAIVRDETTRWIEERDLRRQLAELRIRHDTEVGTSPDEDPSARARR